MLLYTYLKGLCLKARHIKSILSTSQKISLDRAHKLLMKEVLYMHCTYHLCQIILVLIGWRMYETCQPLDWSDEQYKKTKREITPTPHHTTVSNDSLRGFNISTFYLSWVQNHFIFLGRISTSTKCPAPARHRQGDASDATLLHHTPERSSLYQGNSSRGTGF